ncbi:hypothetical protein JAAARDRAFT_28870 [Jaapia argillacea MUCL 33604]|uniref:Gfd2/YDR514C-like C-terminal domain-containing protein n=1 Tax=Jaapia argillacea MUCL 33604 TaxID=933084 RepID=A0A067Q7E2_9AGAM|nr:hypothetical protein JAAARDRAFT_28870 [Jaapia argillacea MUCL 33604]
MADFQLVDPRGWEYDLQSVYSAYLGHFQLYNIPWYERSWGVLFESFDDFLAFSWPVIAVTDAWTGKAHVVTRMTSIGAFLKMIKTRFGETLPNVENILKVSPFENNQRPLRTVSDWSSYKKIYATLPAVTQTAYRTRVRQGEPKAIKELWERKDRTFLAIDFEWSERNTSSCLEWGYAAVRCGHLEALGAWPPVPERNYRKGHYIVQEYVDKVQNRHQPTYPWQYEFGQSQVVGKAKLPQIIQAVISSLVSPDSESTPNNLVLVAHGISGDLNRLEEMKIKIPHNVLIIDTASYERELFNKGHRGVMEDAKTGKPRLPGSTLSLGSLIGSLGLEVSCTLHNSGNDAFLCLLALQMLLDPENTKIPPTMVGNGQGQMGMMVRAGSRSPVPPPMGTTMSMPMMTGYPYMLTPSPMGLSSSMSTPPPDGYFDDSTRGRKAKYASAYLPTPGSSRNSRKTTAMAVSDELGMKSQPVNSEALNRSLRNLTLAENL